MMLRRITLTVALATLVTGAAFAQAPQPIPGDQRPADRDAIRAHIMSIFAAFQKGDRAALRATHAQHWRGYLWGSRNVIKGIDAYMRYVEPGLDGNDPAFELPEFDVLFYGDVAIVNFTADMVLPDGSRRPWLRITDIYVKEAGGWNQAASNTDQHPAAREAQMAADVHLPEPARKSLLAAREAVWRAWFAGDTKQLTELLPEDTIAINSGGEEEWPGRDAILESSRQFAAGGNKLVRLEFPRTEIRAYGRTAVIYTTYLFETESSNGRRSTSTGRATEFFVLRDGKWLNPGWHLDSGR